MTKYFVNQEKYFYLILLHMYAVLCIGITIMLGIGTMVITYIEHICGMFRIARYECGKCILNEFNNFNCYYVIVIFIKQFY